MLREPGEEALRLVVLTLLPTLVGGGGGGGGLTQTLGQVLRRTVSTSQTCRDFTGSCGEKYFFLKLTIEANSGVSKGRRHIMTFKSMEM